MYLSLPSLLWFRVSFLHPNTPASPTPLSAPYPLFAPRTWFRCVTFRTCITIRSRGTWDPLTPQHSARCLAIWERVCGSITPTKSMWAVPMRAQNRD